MESVSETEYDVQQFNVQIIYGQRPVIYGRFEVNVLHRVRRRGRMKKKKGLSPTTLTHPFW
jgi:hypothetical protein